MQDLLAFNRRKKMFTDDLEKDIPMVQALIEENDIKSIKGFAHKYKMRLTYFKYDQELLICKQIEYAFNEDDSKNVLDLANELISSLKSIQSK